jgi:5-hydroxyisourate hydrolase-like protein (transthyretin family)
MSMLLAFALFSCEREFENDIVSTTPPELHVITQNADGDPVEGADVTLYTSEEDYNNETNALATQTTNAEGKAVFTESELTDPGVYYVRAVDGALNNSGSETATPYLLLNDGHTYFYTTLE